ncbi:MAG: hypothetical protein WBN56_10120 [Robiginitalea sp.]|uniref:hypothetical protein n=1 Tax=Robiginitalea sp. TaxID=1902411 RepID=UPI003C73B732
MADKVIQITRRIEVSLVFAITVLVSSCATQQHREPEITPEEYEVINDFFERAHRPLYHHTVNSDLSPTFSDYDSIALRKRYPERTRDHVLENLLRPETLQEIQEKSDQGEELYFQGQYLRHIQVTGKKRNALTISRPIVLDSIAIIRQMGDNNNPVFILKKESDGHWGLRYTFFEKTETD